jgi:hypothetical protein
MPEATLMKLTKIVRDIVVCVVLCVIACFAMSHDQGDLAGVAIGGICGYVLKNGVEANHGKDAK